jgi:hypothetical protein
MNAWALKPDWETTLKALGQRGDILKALAAKNRDLKADQVLRQFEPGANGVEKLLGSVVTSVPEDELRDRRSLIVEDFNRQRWIVDIGLREPGTIPPDGAVIEVGARTPKLREMDTYILKIAERTGGKYSDALHVEADPAATPAWRQGHVRRLEALRLAGIVERNGDGSWHVPQNFADRAVAHDATRSGRLDIQVRSWLSLDEQTGHAGLTWLDMNAEHKLGDRLESAWKARLAFLEQQGWLGTGAEEVDEVLRHRLRTMELRRAVSVLSGSTGRAGIDLVPGDRFEGQFEKAIDLGQGRFAVVGNAKEFALVPWRPEMERHRGRDMAFKRTAAGVSWTIGIERGLER